jgi:hypothetical protein
LGKFCKNIKKCKNIDFFGKGAATLKWEEEMGLKNVLEILKNMGVKKGRTNQRGVVCRLFSAWHPSEVGGGFSRRPIEGKKGKRCLCGALAHILFSTFYLPAMPVHDADVNLYISGGGVATVPTLANASPGVTFDMLTFGANSTFFKPASGRYTDFSTYNVVGTGASYIVGSSGLDGIGKNFNFFIPTFAANGSTMLSVFAGSAFVPVNITGATIRVGIAGDASSIQADHKTTLIRASEVIGGDSLKVSDSGAMPTIIGIQGVSVKYVFTLSTDGTNLLAALPDGTLGTLLEQTKVPLEGYAAATVLLNATIDGAVDGRVFNSTQNDGIFCSISGGKSRRISGFHLDLGAFSVFIGAGKAFELPHGELTFAVFAEGETGHYKSFNSFSTGDVNGKGDSWCLGGSIFARLDGNGSGNGHFYGEGSIHEGRIKHDFSTNDMADFLGVKAAYSSRNTYFGVHGGGGYIHEIGDGIFLDAYAKYIWARRNGKDALLSTGETVDFKNVDSKRLLSGLKLLRKISPDTAAHIGGACHYEFDGEVNGSIAGIDIDAPSIHGASAMVELGITGNWNGFSFDFDAQRVPRQTQGPRRLL